MNNISDQEEIMLNQIANLCVTNDAQDKILVGYRNTITRLHEEIKSHEYNDLQLQSAQLEIIKLHKALGR